MGSKPDPHPMQCSMAIPKGRAARSCTSLSTASLKALESPVTWGTRRCLSRAASVASRSFHKTKSQPETRLENLSSIQESGRDQGTAAPAAARAIMQASNPICESQGSDPELQVPGAGKSPRGRVAYLQVVLSL